MKLIKSYFPNNNAKGWEFYDLGVVEYSDGLEIQNKEKLKVSNNSENKLLLLEHNPVITLGRRTKIEHLLESKEEIVKKGSISLKLIEEVLQLIMDQDNLWDI